MSTAVTVHTQDDTKEPEGVNEDLVFRLLSDANKGKRANVEEALKVLPPDSADYDKRTGLMLCVAGGHLEIAQLFVDAGADVNFKDNFGNTAMDEAAKWNHSEIVKYLSSKGGNYGKALGEMEGDLIEAAAQNDTAKAKQLLEYGVDPSCKDYDSRTPLHLAVGNGYHDMVDLLMAYKADPNAIDRWKTTPLDEARKNKPRVGHDEMSAKFAAYFEAGTHSPWINGFTAFLLIWEVLMCILYYLYGRYQNPTHDPNFDATAAKAHFDHMYPYFQDIHVMIFIGFGFLMTFLRKNMYSSVGFTFLLGAFCVQWHIIAGSFLEHWIVAHDGEAAAAEVDLFGNSSAVAGSTNSTDLYVEAARISSDFTIDLNIDKLILGDFAAGVVLIAYGVLLGKVNHFQLLIMAIFEIIFFAINESILINMAITDKGGSMVVHMFGAFFGCAASIVLKNKKAAEDNDNAPVYHSDMFAMIGTVFLWMFWPSFNSVYAEGATQEVAIVNTVLSLVGSAVGGFLFSFIFRREARFNMVDIQNATLAGGVAMGTACNLYISPVSAVLIGLVAGLVSCAGYAFLQEKLQTCIGLHDTCGVLNLHGMPSLIGAFAGAVVIAIGTKEAYGSELANALPEVASGARSFAEQAQQQTLATLITLGISLASGALTGVIMKSPPFAPMNSGFFKDDGAWEVPSVEIPHYFDSKYDATVNRNNKQSDTIVNLVSRLDLAESRVKSLLKKDNTSKLESIFEKVLAKMEKIN